jgi:hypothetical protein
LWSVLGLGLAILVWMASAQTVMAQTNAGRLTIQLTNVVNEAIMDYDNIVAPEVPADGGMIVVPIICYCGPAIVLGVDECGTNCLTIESSRDLVSWASFPQPGLQLMLDTNSPALIPMTGTNRFFRGVWVEASSTEVLAKRPGSVGFR